MATLTVRDLPGDIRDKLRIRAAENGRSMEAEVRAVLRAAVRSQETEKATVRERVQRLQAVFAPYRAVEGSIVDELIAERRIEGWREELESLEDLTSGRAGDSRERIDAWLAKRRSGS